jgi:hypothetical protein
LVAGEGRRWVTILIFSLVRATSGMEMGREDVVIAGK